jgi:tetratricopeptide (TPR) repeat protein
MDQFSAHLDRGWDLVNRGDFFGARLSAEKSLEIDSNSPEPYNLLGYIHAAQGDAEEALDNYRQALAIDETFFEAMLNAAEVLIHPLREFDAAVNMVDEALDLARGDDEVADALLLKFDAHMQRADREASARVAAIMPQGPFENAQLDYMVGRAKFEVDDLEGGEALLLSAVRRSPENGDARYYLGLVHEARGDRTSAIADFIKTRELDLRAPSPCWSLGPEQFEQRIRQAIQSLPEPVARTLQGALVIIGELPGIEVIADGVDPRAEVLIEEMSQEGEPPAVGRLFVYQRNIERAAAGPLNLEEEVVRCISQELLVLFPELSEQVEKFLGSGDTGTADPH